MRANQDYYNYNNWVGTKNLVFGSVFLYKYAGFFNMLGAWHPPNILPTMVHVQAFCIMTRQQQSRATHWASSLAKAYPTIADIT